MTSKNGGYVTWSAFLAVGSLLLTLAIAVNAIVWSLHGKGQGQFEKRIIERFDGVEKRLDKIDNKLDRR